MGALELLEPPQPDINTTAAILEDRANFLNITSP
jgi:hypothetical protein